MSLLTYNFESEYLNNNHQITVILPDKKRGISPAEFYGSNKKYTVHTATIPTGSEKRTLSCMPQKKTL